MASDRASATDSKHPPSSSSTERSAGGDSSEAYRQYKASVQRSAHWAISECDGASSSWGPSSGWSPRWQQAARRAASAFRRHRASISVSSSTGLLDPEPVEGGSLAAF